MPEWAHFISEAFVALEWTRETGMGGVGTIPWTAIDAYARRHLIEGEMFDALVHGIRAMDAAFLEHIKRKIGGV